MQKQSRFKDALVITNIPRPNGAFVGDEFEWHEVKVWDPDYEMNRIGLKDLPDFKTDYTPQAKDKVYFLPGCNCPRFKVRPWLKNYKASVTIKRDNATAIVASDNILNHLITRVSYVRVPKSQMLVWLNQNYQLGDSNVSDLYQEVANNPNKFVFLGTSYHAWRGQEYTGYNPNYLYGDFKTKLAEQPGVDCQAGIDVVLGDDSWEQMQLLFTNSNIYSQDTLINQINEGATIIDEKLYEELRVMLGSQDDSNYPMALEIMASSNLNHSVLYILKLLREFKDTIYNCKERNHVNFKSLLEYLDLKSNWYHMTDDDFVEVLKNTNQLTMDILKPLAEGVKEEWKSRCESKHFRISKITISDELKDYFLEKQRKKQLQKQKLEKECQQ